MTAFMSRRLALVLLLVMAFVPRCLQLISESAYLHPDALYQGLEPAFSIVWGHGLMPWEFREGLRSWAWPGLLSAPMGMLRMLGCSGPGIGMDLAVLGARAIVVALDVCTVLIATRFAWAAGGPLAAAFCGCMLAAHPAFFVMGAQPLIDIPAATTIMWTCERALSHPLIDRRRAAALGAGSVLAILVRVQLAPALLMLVLVLAWRTRSRSTRWQPGAARTLATAGIFVALLWGAIDAVTLGAPFSATVRYLAFNVGEGTRAFGTMPADRYARDFVAAFGLLAPALPILALAGLRRAAGPALVLLAIFFSHQILPYRVWRFLHPALPLLVLVAAVGLSHIVERLRPSRWSTPLLGSIVVLGLLELVLALAREAPWSTTWLHAQGGAEAVERSRALNSAYLELSRGPAPRQVAQAVLPAAASPGYALLGHEVPVIPVLDAGINRPQSAETDVWLVPLPVPAIMPGFALVWSDPTDRVGILRKVGEQELAGADASAGLR